MNEIKISSQAQHAMLERAAADPDYARSRGIDPQLAARSIEAHNSSGGPELPPRAAPAPGKPKAASKPASINTRPKGFGPR
jgi:hypothetical protein